MLYSWEYGSPGVRLVWAARWEWDKRPDRLLALVRVLEQRSISFKLAVLGDQGKGLKAPPEALRRLYEHYGDRVVQFGYVESREEYYRWLKTADFVLSTAEHEFQGLSVLEAVKLGCVPVLPKRLSYPELVPQKYLYDGDEDLEKEASNAADLIVRSKEVPYVAPDIDQIMWSNLKQSYAKRINKTASIQLPSME